MTGTYWHTTVACLGYAYVLSGRLAEAAHVFWRRQPGFHSIKSVESCLCVAWLSEVCLLAGRTSGGLDAARRSHLTTLPIKNREARGAALHHLASSTRRALPPAIAQAEGYYQQALALAEESGMCPFVAHCHHGLGTLYAQTGQREQARAALSSAIELYRSMDMTFWLPQAETALAQVL